MKTTIARIAVLTIVILAILLSVRPQQDTAAVTQFTVGVPSETTHSKPATWANAYHYVPVTNRLSQFPVMCFDPLLTSTLILDVDGCGAGQAVAVKQDTEVHIVTVDVPATPNVDNENPVIIDDGGETVPSDDTPSADADKKHCNKGSGNGSEGCDPGNRPDNGNNDEGGDRRPENSNGGGNSH